MLGSVSGNSSKIWSWWPERARWAVDSFIRNDRITISWSLLLGSLSSRSITSKGNQVLHDFQQHKVCCSFGPQGRFRPRKWTKSLESFWSATSCFFSEFIGIEGLKIEARRSCPNLPTGIDSSSYKKTWVLLKRMRKRPSASPLRALCRWLHELSDFFRSLWVKHQVHLMRFDHICLKKEDHRGMLIGSWLVTDILHRISMMQMWAVFWTSGIYRCSEFSKNLTRFQWHHKTHLITAASPSLQHGLSLSLRHTFQSFCAFMCSFYSDLFVYMILIRCTNVRRPQAF